jgi:hypothetical protein
MEAFACHATHDRLHGNAPNVLDALISAINVCGFATVHCRTIELNIGPARFLSLLGCARQT